MTISEPNDSMPHSESGSTNGVEAAEQSGRRFAPPDTPGVTEAPSTEVTSPPVSAPQPPPEVPDFTPPGYGPPSAYAAPTYADPTSAPPASYAPQPPIAQAPPADDFPPPPQAPPPPAEPQESADPELPSGPERVGRGVLFSLGGVVVGIVATVVLWQLNFIAAFTSLLMAWACIWLYVKGAGQPPRKGVFAVVGVILVGVVLSLVAAVSSDAVVYANEYFGQPSISDYTDTIVLVLSTPEVWAEYSTSIAMYVLFAALGTVGIIMQLARGKQTT